jgi:hypothetical protein
MEYLVLFPTINQIPIYPNLTTILESIHFLITMNK